MSSIKFCEKCGKEHDGSFGTGRFCSRSCANSRVQTAEANKARSEKKIGRAYGAALLNKGKPAKNRATLENGKLLKGTCPVCGKEFTFHKHTPRKFCSRSCWDKVSGGYREGSVTNYVHGRYEGFYYDSSWELIWIKWALKNNIHFERNTKGFPYIYKGKTHKYYPDFYIASEDLYVEIKGRVDDLWETKKAAFPYKLKVLTKAEIKALERVV